MLGDSTNVLARLDFTFAIPLQQESAFRLERCDVHTSATAAAIVSKHITAAAAAANAANAAANAKTVASADGASGPAAAAAAVG